MYEFTRFMSTEHEQITALFRSYQDLRRQAPDAARQRLAEFSTRLEVHMQVEEQIMFPRFEALSHFGTSGPTTVMRGEHREIRFVLARLQTLPAGHGEIDALEDKLFNALRAHEAMEDLIFNPWIDEVLSETDRLILFEQVRHFHSGVLPQVIHAS